MQDIVAAVWMRHLHDGHNAEFEVCQHWRCQLAMVLERRLYQWGVWGHD